MSHLDQARLNLMHRYWQAANYLTVGQIYLQDNPLLREPLRPEQIKPRLLGHWGTSPGLSFIYVHLNRLIQDHDVNMIYLAGPGHGGPALLANVYLEGTYSEVYPLVSQDTEGMRRLFCQFSTPGGVPSHVSVPTPGSIHEGGELGYVLSHAFGAAFDNPDLIVVAVIGDGEAETAPLEGAWKSLKFLNPVRDGAVLPILHLNGYKISGPTVMGRESDDAIQQQLSGYGYNVHFVEGDDPMTMHRAFAQTLETCYEQIRLCQEEARRKGVTQSPRWPVLVLRTPKGWTGPEKVDGVQIEGTFRAHQVPVADVKENPEHLRILEQWLQSYQPRELFDEHGRLLPELAALAPRGKRRMGHHLPELKVRVVNVVDLMKLYPQYLHPHGIDDASFVEYFTQDRPVVFAFHGYARAIHEVVHGRPHTPRFHVRGFMEEGTTTTPFDMVVRNGMSRYHLCIEAMRRATRLRELTPPLIAECNDMLARHNAYVLNTLEDLPEVRDWAWTD